jgi:RecB family exonuclease
MGLHIVTGAANAGKTGAIHGAVRAAVRGKKTSLLLLPSVPDVRRAQEELAAECALGLSVSGFDSFLDSLWIRLCDGRSIVGRTQRLLLIEKAIEAATLTLLAESSQRPGFVRLAESLVIRAAEGPGPQESPPGDGAAGELLSIVLEYQRLLTAEGLVERGEAHRLTAERAGELDLPSVIVVNRFGSLSARQEQFLCAAAPHSDVWVAVTWVDGAPATAAADELVRRLSSIGQMETITISPTATDAQAELTALERDLFLPGIGATRGTSPSGAIVLSEAWGSEAEAARITREIQDAITEGAAPGDIAVVFRDPLRHVERLRSSFDEAGIQAEYDLYLPLTATGFGRAMGQLLAFFCAGAERRDLMGFLRTPFIQGDNDALDRIDAGMRLRRLTGLRALLSAAGRVDERAAATLSRAQRLCAGQVDEASLQEWWRLVSDMMSTAYGTAPIFDEREMLDARAMRVVIDALAEMASIDAASFDARDLLAFLNDARISVFSEERSDRVQVLGAERLRGRRFSRVILGGLTADEFPQPASEDALTAAPVIKRLRESGIDVASRVDTEAERMLFYQVVTRARHKLVLSRRVSDEDGRPTRPSPLLEELLDLYRDPGRGEGAWYRGSLPIRVVTLSDLSSGPDVPDTDRRAMRALLAADAAATDAAFEPRLAYARWRGRARARCVGETVTAMLASRTVYSASEIEVYLKCPYRWYVDRMLRPESLDVELDASAVGRAAHEIMRRFYERHEEQTGCKRVTPATLEGALRIHSAVAAEELGVLQTIGLEEEARVRRIARATRRLVVEDAELLEGYVPTAHEWGFGFGEEDPEDFGTFALRGRIDRIDSGPEGFVITDYKSGSVNGMQMAKFEDAGLVQLPLYAEVVRRRHEFGDPVAGFYRSVLNVGKPRGFFREGAVDAKRFTRTDGCTEERISELIAEAITRASAAVEGMRAGRIDQSPEPSGCPDYCSARVYCEGGR